MDFALRLAPTNDLAIIHAIRRAAILGIAPVEFTLEQLQTWAERRSPEYFAPMVEQRLLVPQRAHDARANAGLIVRSASEQGFYRRFGNGNR